MHEADINCENLGGNDEDFSIKITRAKFEQLCLDLFNLCIPCVEQTLEDAKLERQDINEVVLVGGSTRIPKI